ncbi:uncharacterized protein LOC135196236 [Macrobrachium nipponense]|uniref:uncharacterized protein LOC135196236 n=1 Tax=Macrobrachium nipponense TaxID=159736 RepID=UPI0030C7EEF6
MTLVPYKNENSSYFFKKSSVPGTYNWEADNLLYVALTEPMTTNIARTNCLKIPGHRLIIVKSKETYDHFLARAVGNTKPYWTMDLIKKTHPDDLVWGDGTVPNRTIVTIDVSNSGEHFFALYSNHIEDVKENPYRVLCQANPLGVEW